VKGDASRKSDARQSIPPPLSIIHSIQATKGQKSHDGGKYEHIQFFVMETSRLGLVASRDEVERTRSEIKKTGKSHEQSLTCDVGGPEI
jgi:hypothetical protein